MLTALCATCTGMVSNWRSVCRHGHAIHENLDLRYIVCAYVQVTSGRIADIEKNTARLETGSYKYD